MTVWAGCWARLPARSCSPAPPAAERRPRSTRACASWPRALNGQRSLATLEDPIEAVVPGVAQAQVEPGRGPHARVGPQVALAARPGGHRNRRDSRPGHGRDRASGRTHRPPDPDHVPRRQRLRGDRPAARHGNRAIRRSQRASRRGGPAPGATALLVLEPGRAPRGVPGPAGAKLRDAARLRALPGHRLPRPHRARGTPAARAGGSRAGHPGAIATFAISSKWPCKRE